MTTAPARALRAPLRTALIVTAALSGAGLLLAACSSSGNSASPTTGVAPRPAYGAPVTAGPAKTAGRTSAVATATLVQPQSIIYTADLTVRAADVAAAASMATSLVQAAGGYVAAEQETIPPGNDGSAQVSLELKIPVAQYPAILGQLETKLGKQIFLSQQAQDVTQQVADVGSRVASAQAAISQLRTLLSRAGSIGDLLAVQDQINAQEAALEALLAQQRALAHETSYATVSLLLVTHHVRAVKHPKQKSRGFGAGLRAGWHALLAVITAILTALGAALPFAVPVALLAGLALVGGRRLVRRRTPPTTTPPPAVP